MEFLTDLFCTRCEKSYSKDKLWNLSPCCSAPLFARYDLGGVSKALSREQVTSRSPTMWRYAEILPVERGDFRVRLGEGFTPLLLVGSLGEALGVGVRHVRPDHGALPVGAGQFADPAHV